MSEQLTDDEIQALSEKIERFAVSLSDRERDAFATALLAGDSDTEVSGFEFNKNPIGAAFAGLSFTKGLSTSAFPSQDTKGLREYVELQ